MTKLGIQVVRREDKTLLDQPCIYYWTQEFLSSVRPSVRLREAIKKCISFRHCPKEGGGKTKDRRFFYGFPKGSYPEKKMCSQKGPSFTVTLLPMERAASTWSATLFTTRTAILPGEGAVLHCTALHCTALDSTAALHCTVLDSTAALHCTVLDSTASLHCIALHCTVSVHHCIQ